MENNPAGTPFRIKENSWLAKIAAWKLKAGSVAIVMGHTIHLCHTSKKEFLENKNWLKHELCHVRQFEEHGFLTFIVKYTWESIRHGYFNNKYEIAARQAEQEP